MLRLNPLQKLGFGKQKCLPNSVKYRSENQAPLFPEATIAICMPNHSEFQTLCSVTQCKRSHKNQRKKSTISQPALSV